MQRRVKERWSIASRGPESDKAEEALMDAVFVHITERLCKEMPAMMEEAAREYNAWWNSLPWYKRLVYRIYYRIRWKIIPWCMGVVYTVRHRIRCMVDSI